MEIYSDKVSVYIPTHNRSALVSRAIMSVLNQSYKNIELIVCDDGSSDNTQRVLNDFASSDNRVIILRNDKPKGACFSRNRCIEIATGQYITGLDDDDEFLPERIERFLSFAKNKKLDFLSSNVLYSSDDNLKKGVDFQGIVDSNMIGYRNIIGNQVFIKTELMKSVGGFDINAPAWQDYDLWFRLIHEKGPCVRLNDYTYIMDISHTGPRITTGSNAHKGYLYFITKHKEMLSKKQLHTLFIEDKVNRGDSVTFLDILKHPVRDNFIFFFKGIMKKYIPGINYALDKRKKF